MYYRASVNLATEHPDLDAAVRGLDEYLIVNEGHQVRVGHVAAIVGRDPGLVGRLMELYAAAGAVQRDVAYICPMCDSFMEHSKGEGDLWCDICEKSFSYRGAELLGENVWRVLPEAAKTGWTPPVKPAAIGPAPPPPVKIQFVSGDRGGGIHSQVRANREEKEITKAVKQGAFRDWFDFAPPIYSASVRDVIQCHRHGPKILHFAGHGEERKLLLVRDRDIMGQMDHLLPEQMETLLANFTDRVRLIVFNTCLSLGLARHITENGTVDLAIGAERMINDDHAVQFATTFYGQLAEGLSVRRAFNFAAIHFGNVEASAKLLLLEAPGVDAGAVVFAEPVAKRK